MQTLIDTLACIIAIGIFAAAIHAVVKAFTKKVTAVATWDELDDEELSKAFAMLPESPALTKAFDERFGRAASIYDGPPLLRVIFQKRAIRRVHPLCRKPK